MRVKASLLLLIFVMMLSFSVDLVVGEKKAPDFTLVDIDGNLFTLSECAARVVLIDFFATWCGPCKAAIPSFRSLYNEYSRDHLEIISLSSEDGGILRDFAQQQNMEWIVARDTTGVIDDYYEGSLSRPIPRTFLVDATATFVMIILAGAVNQTRQNYGLELILCFREMATMEMVTPTTILEQSKLDHLTLL